MLDFLFRPKAVAVVGASREPGKVGHTVLENLLSAGFRGAIYPVNPKAQEILGLKAYPSVSAIPGEVELAVIAIRAPLVPQVIEECGKKGVRAAVILSAGFRETGREGAQLEREVLTKAQKFGLRIVGPNCLGVLDTYARLNVTFAAVKPLRGAVGFFSQSGALCLHLLEWSRAEKVGLSRFVSLGNKCDVSEVECLRALGEDPHTRVILGYLEGIDDGRAFVEVAREVSRKKPVVIFKSGVTGAGARAASSHTGSLAGSEQAFSAAVKKARVIRAATLQEFFDQALFFALQPPMKGPAVAVLTNSGGPGIVAADAIERSALEIPTLGPETVDKLRKILPPYAAFYNPVDVAGDADAERYEKALQILLEDPKINGILIILSHTATVDPAEVAERIIRKKGKKPLTACFLGKESVRKGASLLKRKGVPVFPYPEEAVVTLEKSWLFTLLSQKTEGREESPPKVDFARAAAVMKQVREEERNYLYDHEVREILEAYGFRFPKSLLARTTEEALLAAKVIGYPLVLKVVSPEIQHKTDLGGVKVNIRTEEELIQGFQEILFRVKKALPRATITGILVQEMITNAREVILGFTRDPQFGPMVMFGLGGIYVEVLKDVSFRLAPLEFEEAREMIREIRGYGLLRGVRGEEEADLPALTSALVALSRLAVDFPELVEGEVNPFMVRRRGEGAVAVDARLILEG
ncbi:MAG TPA: CoA-binding protein [Thermodesulfatator atlanticus]|uniref:CoA-binding protein n=1 Tax=Thermodesulfatator atlanticus TaxID=501497 RepID=A0A7V5NZ39_9BACT|nr:CoA-binding protein [Thermodesulfatator atlanticus]